MPRNWSKCTLGDAIVLQRGFDLPLQDRQPGKIPIVSSSGVSGRHSKIGVAAPGVVTGRYGTIGKVFFVTEDFWPLNTTLYVKDFRGNDPRFISYLLQTIDFQSCSDKSSVPGVNRNDLHRIIVNIPGLSDQRGIAHVLGALDDKIESNRQMNETLEAMARAIFKSWFVDFDPVRAKAEGRQPFVMDAETAALFSDSFQDSPLGKIPKGWDVARLPEIIEINPLCSLARGATATYLDMHNMPTRGHRPENWKLRPFVSGSRFMNGDTLLARITPCLENGKTAFVDFLRNDEVAWGSTEFIVLRPKNHVPPEFGYCLARDEEFRTFVIQNMTGSSGRQRVPTDCFGQFWITVPPERIARRFGEIVCPLFAKVKANSEASTTLAAIRDALLPNLISGEIRVDEIRYTSPSVK
jgi:type I restriction enzyme S subunit